MIMRTTPCSSGMTCPWESPTGSQIELSCLTSSLHFFWKLYENLRTRSHAWNNPSDGLFLVASTRKPTDRLVSCTLHIESNLVTVAFLSLPRRPTYCSSACVLRVHIWMTFIIPYAMAITALSHQNPPSVTCLPSLMTKPVHFSFPRQSFRNLQETGGHKIIKRNTITNSLKLPSQFYPRRAIILL